MLPAQSLDEVTLRVHQVKVDAVVNQVVLSGRNTFRRAEVDPVGLAHGLDIVVGARQADELGVELGQVLLQLPGPIARGVARHKDAVQAAGNLLLDNVNHVCHLVKLFGADVGAVGEAKVDLTVRAQSSLVSHA